MEFNSGFKGLKPSLLWRVSTDIQYAEMVKGTGITESVY